MAEDVRLYLISAKKSRTTGHWPDDDYDVRLGAPDGPDIGRIYGGDVAQNGSWFWGINLVGASKVRRCSWSDTA